MNQNLMTQTTFCPTDGAFIEDQEAEIMVRKYQNSRFFEQANGVESFFLGKDRIQEILNTEHCTGIRIYLAVGPHPNGGFAPRVLLAGNDVNGNKIVTADGTYLNKSKICPPYCPVDDI